MGREVRRVPANWKHPKDEEGDSLSSVTASSERIGETFESVLNKLREAGLPSIPSEIVGRLYRFGCEHGSHQCILCGRIQAIEVSDEGGLNLYVTNPLFCGERLISIKHSNGKWVAYVDIKPRERSDKSLEQMSKKEHERVIAEAIAARFFEGEFELL